MVNYIMIASFGRVWRSLVLYKLPILNPQEHGGTLLWILEMQAFMDSDSST